MLYISGYCIPHKRICISHIPIPVIYDNYCGIYLGLYNAKSFHLFFLQIFTCIPHVWHSLIFELLSHVLKGKFTLIELFLFIQVDPFCVTKVFNMSKYILLIFINNNVSKIVCKNIIKLFKYDFIFFLWWHIILSRSLYFPYLH